jgi:hypothetical protein
MTYTDDDAQAAYDSPYDEAEAIERGDVDEAFFGSDHDDAQDESYAEWVQAGKDATYPFDPDYGRDLDDDYCPDGCCG